MPMSGLPEDAIERFFEKSSEKRERFQKFWKYTRCGRFFQKSGTVFRIFGNIPDKAWTLSEFLAIYLIWKIFWKKLERFRIFCICTMMATAETPEGGYPRKKSRFFFKGSRKKSGHLGKKLGRVNFFRIYSKMVRLKRGIRERNWIESKKSKIFQK